MLPSLSEIYLKQHFRLLKDLKSDAEFFLRKCNRKDLYGKIRLCKNQKNINKKTG